MRLATVLLLALAASAETPVFRIAGVVVDSVSGKPAPRVRVVVRTSGQGASEISSWMTGDDGRFYFDVLKGKYSLVAERSGQAPQPYGAVGVVGSAVAIVTGPDQQTSNVRFELFPPSAIGGKVVDDAGDPVENALVQLMRGDVVAGRRRIGNAGYAYTNDVGEYRFGNLQPGSYYLGVTGKPWYASGPFAAGRPVAFTPVYYPNTADSRAAAALVLKAGQETRADFALVAKPGVDISVLLDGKSVKDFSRMVVDLIGDNIGISNVFQSVSSTVGSSFRIPAVPPGSYKIRVRPDGDSQFAWTQEIIAGAENVAVRMELAPPPAVSGVLELPAGASDSAGGFYVLLSDVVDRVAYTAAVSDKGSFKYPRINPGKYHVLIGGSRSAYVKSVVEGETTLEGSQIEIKSGDARTLRIVAASDGGRVDGFVRRAGQPVPGVLVALIPADSSDEPSRYRGYWTDSDGSYEFLGVQPGDYRLIVSSDRDLEWANPAVIRPRLADGKPIHVEPNGKQEVDAEAR